MWAAIPAGNCTTPDGGFSRGRTGVLSLECKPELASGVAFLPRKQFPAGTAVMWAISSSGRAVDS